MHKKQFLLKNLMSIQSIQRYFVLVVLVFLLNVICIKQSYSQKGVEIGANVGFAYYMGDINLVKHFYSPHVDFGGFFRYHFNERTVLRVGAIYTNLSAYDKDFNNKFQLLRGHSFKTSLFELSALYEVHFLPYLICNTRKHSYTPYVQLGIATYFASTTDKSFNFAIPIGIGFKKNILPRLVLGVEWTFRKTFTDMLDTLSGEDLSSYSSNYGIKISGDNIAKQRGFRFNKDWYSTASLTLSYAFKVKGLTCNAYYSR